MSKNILLVLTLGFLSIGCALNPFGHDNSHLPSPEQKALEQTNINIFERGSAYLDAKNYEKAIENFEKILNRSPSTNLEFITLFNLGLAYEGAKACKKAVDVYRLVVKTTSREQMRLQAQSLYRLSYAYECLGQESKVISALLDVKRRGEYLDSEVAMAEVPARLAGAYARMGNKKLAEKFFAEAELGIKSISTLRRSKEKKKEILSRTLYMMGFFDPTKFSESESEKYLYSLEYVQRYLLRSVEMDHEIWSARSAEMLLSAYDQVWALLKEIESNQNKIKSPIEVRNSQKKKIELARSTINSIQLLKRERFPMARPTQMMDVLFNQIDNKEKRLQTYVAKTQLTNELTSEDKARFGIKRKGRLVDPPRGNGK